MRYQRLITETVATSITVGMVVFGLSFNTRSIKYSDSKFRNVKYEGQFMTTTEGNTGDELHQKPFAADMEALYRFFSNPN